MRRILYSKQVVADLVAQGTPPAMVQVGNEISAGMLWPDGSTSNWSRLAALLKEGIAGSRPGRSSPETAGTRPTRRPVTGGRIRRSGITPTLPCLR